MGFYGAQCVFLNAFCNSIGVCTHLSAAIVCFPVRGGLVGCDNMGGWLAGGQTV